jgi:phage terminase large subunit
MITVDFSGLPDVTNDKFYPLYFDRNRYLVLVGGGGSGKSVFAASKIIYRCMTEPGHRFMVVRKVKDTLRDSVFAELVNVIERWGMRELWQIPKGRSSEIYLKCLNGSEILFYGLDDVEKRKSIQGITGIWVEEASELDPGDFRQLNIRLRGPTKYPKQMILSFNPIYKGHWLEEEFLSPDWSSKKPDATTHHSTYKDNRFLDEENKAVLESFREKDEYYYTVYCLGEWGVLGKTIFPARIVSERIAYLRDYKPIKQGFFAFEYEAEKITDDSITWIDDPGGYISIYAEPKPGYPYVIGGDTAGDGSDNFTGHVIDNTAGIQVAVLKHQFDEDLYTRQMYCLGKHYNTALVGIETNFSTFPVKEMTRLGYWHQYNREVPDTYTGRLEKKYGFQTNKLTRPLVIAGLVQIVREHPGLIWDIPTLEEMLTFVRNEKGRAEAQEGEHDDLIMGLAITHYIRDQAAMQPVEEKPQQAKKLADKLGINKREDDSFKTW